MDKAYIYTLSRYQYSVGGSVNGSVIVKTNGAQIQYELTSDEIARIDAVLWDIVMARRESVADSVRNISPPLLQHKTIDAE